MSEPEATVVEKYEAEVAAAPNSVEAKCNLGWGHYGERQYDQAVAAFREALAMDASNVDAQYGLGMSLKEAGEHAAAVPAFIQVMKLAPKEAGVRGQMLARLARGHINQMKKGDWDLGEEMRYESSE